MEIGLENAAMLIAREAHEGQKYGEQTYFEGHLATVVGVAHRFGVIHRPTLAACWLHDSVEDTDLTLGELKTRLGVFKSEDVEFTLAIVDAVTDGIEGNRAARKARSYALIPNVASAVIVKLFDRIANVEASIAESKLDPKKRKLVEMYRSEQAGMKAKIASESPSDLETELWEHLEGLLANCVWET